MSVLTLPFPSFFTAKQTLCFEGSLGALAAVPSTRHAIIASPRTQEEPALKRILAKTRRTHSRCFTPSWTGEPTLPGLKKTLQDIEAFRPDHITAIGGGRILDGAKLLWARYEHPHFPEDRLKLPFSLPKLRQHARFTCVPTTAGTGSESSSTAVYTDHKTGQKIPVVSHEFLPDLAILDPELLFSLPKKWICLSGLDALSHAIEGFVSNQDNAIANALVVPAITDLFQSLKQLSKKYSLDALETALRGANLAGIIQNLMLVGPAHALAHQLGKTHIPHGLATGLLLPQVISHIQSKSKSSKEKYHYLATTLGFQSQKDWIRAIAELPELFDINPVLSAWPKAKKPSASIGKKANEDRLARFFPCSFTNQELQTLIETIWI